MPKPRLSFLFFFVVVAFLVAIVFLVVIPEGDLLLLLLSQSLLLSPLVSLLLLLGNPRLQPWVSRSRRKRALAPGVCLLRRIAATNSNYVQQGSRTLTPAFCNSAFNSRESVTPKWKMLAANAASALPRPNTSTKCPAVPAPPLAITGISTAELTIAVNSQSNPPRIPSVSIEVSKISPAPRSSASQAQSKTRRPVAFRPPLTKTSASSTEAPSFRRASIATITACAPKLPPISPINSGRAIADELILTLSAPASNTAAASSALRIPPPTVNGTNNAAAVRFTVSSSVPRPSWVAVISSSTISSAPAAA
jgi:hypothetical protein